jgi:response regulator RpfG family c-di-GMP phosphodiesterase/predicted Ser/Thr protein kinase
MGLPHTIFELSSATSAGNSTEIDRVVPAEPTLSVQDFIGRIKDSRLLARQQLADFLAQHPYLLDGNLRELTNALIGQGLLTEFQTTHLLKGQLFGLVLGNYRVVERLGAGGMGVVYKAEHIHLKRAVAIKVLISDADYNSIFLQRFYSEMQATAVLSHPNIVLAFDAGEVAGPNSPADILHYLVMEYVPGENLERYVLERGPLPIAQACEYLRQAASGLQHAYEHGVVHRDIKPSNFVVTPQNQVKILDFGLARLSRRRHTEAHTMLGSIDYVAPEQARDARSVDIRADIYALGGTLYWLLSGIKPFPGDRPALEALQARQRETPVPLHQLRSEVPLELEAVVCQMMAQDPGDRYQTPLAVMTALAPFVKNSESHPPVAKRSDITTETPSKQHSKEKAVAALLHQLDQSQRLRDADLCQAQEVLIFAMAKMAELRGLETGGHLLRMQSYVRALAEEAMRLPAFQDQLNSATVRMLERCVLLHDIGKVAIPDHILLKPGKLDAEERSVMESHTVVGADILTAVSRQHGASLSFLQMAVDICRHHHERFDGTGYPAGLAGEAIPLCARIVAIADVYDALRSRLVYKPGLAHLPAKRLILDGNNGQFDPSLLIAFRHCEATFEQIFAQTRD